LFKAISISDLTSLDSHLCDAEITHVVDCIGRTLPAIQESLKTKTSGPELTLAGMCRIISEAACRVLAEEGLNVKILEGLIEVEPNSWTEHQVLLLRLKQYWVVIDFTAGQFEQYLNAPLLVLITAPNLNALRQALGDSFKWWLGDETA
jgi:hypothetical protein